MSGTGSSFACRARTSWRIATAWCAVVAASVLPLAAQSGSNSFHDIAGDTTIVDRLYYSLTRDQQGVEDVSLLTPSIVAYCADPDGCSLTIMATRETSEEFWSRSVRTLYVTPNGNRWRIFFFDGTPVIGRLDDGTESILVQTSVTSDSTCNFREKESMLGFFRYHFELDFAAADNGTEITCRLTIAD